MNPPKVMVMVGDYLQDRDPIDGHNVFRVDAVDEWQIKLTCMHCGEKKSWSEELTEADIEMGSVRFVTYEAPLQRKLFYEVETQSKD